MKQRKVMDVMHRGQNLICIKTDDKLNPYRVYLRYYDLREDGCGYGYRRRELVRYATMESVLYFVYDYFAHA